MKQQVAKIIMRGTYRIIRDTSLKGRQFGVYMYRDGKRKLTGLAWTLSEALKMVASTVDLLERVDEYVAQNYKEG